MQQHTNTLPQQEATVTTSLTIPAALHRRTKLNAVKAETTIQAMAIRGLEAVNAEIEAALVAQDAAEPVQTPAA